jgi:hypothetical protein
VSSIVGKLFEKVLLKKILPTLREKQNELQRGFTKDVAPTNAALLSCCSSKDLEMLPSHFTLEFMF